MQFGRHLIWRPGLLARNVFGSTWWMGLRVAIMASYLVALTRLLGPADYGGLTAAIAAASLLGPLTGLGLSPLIVLHGSRNETDLSVYWGKFLSVWLASVPLLCILVFFLWYAMLSDGISLGAMVPLAVAEVALMPLLGGAYHALQAKEIIVPAFRIDAFIATLRLAVVLLLLFFGINDLSVFAWLYLMSTLAGLAFALRVLGGQLGGLTSLVRPSLSDFGDAGAFLLLDLNGRAAGALDKLFLLHLQGSHAVGLYSAGLRVIEAASMPFGALLRSVAPRLFRRENGADAGPRASMRAVAAAVTVLGLLIAGAVYLLAPLLPVLLGADWGKSVSIVRWLALFPLLYGLHHTLLTRVVGISSPRTRLWIELAGLITGVLLYAALIPCLGMLGAVLGQLGSHGVAILLALVVLLQRRQAPPPKALPL